MKGNGRVKAFSDRRSFWLTVYRYSIIRVHHL